jgi:hypothetical protein
MTNFNSRPILSDIQFRQDTNDDLRLSGSTHFDKVGGVSITHGDGVDIPIILTGGTNGDTLKYQDGAIKIVALTPDELPLLTEDVTANIEVGGIWAQRLISGGTSLTQFVKKLLVTTFYPTYSDPTFSFTSNYNGNNVESGTHLDTVLIYTYNRGTINGNLSGGIWNPSLSQNPRGGAAILYTIDGTANGTANTLTRTARLIDDGSNNFNASVTYDIGAQPLDSYGQPSDPNHDNIPDVPYPAGTDSKSTTIVGRRKTFYGVSSPANTSAAIRSLTSSFSTTTFTINIPIGATNVVFAYKNTLTDVTSVKYVEGLNAEVKGIFTKLADIAVEGAEGYATTNYKLYMYTPAVPFSATATYNVTI